MNEFEFHRQILENTDTMQNFENNKSLRKKEIKRGRKRGREEGRRDGEEGGKEGRADSLQKLMGKTYALCIYLQTSSNSIRM